MGELELLKSLLKKRKELFEIELNIQYEDVIVRKAQLESEKQKIIDELSITESKLINHPTKEYSRLLKSSMLKQLQVYIDYPSKAISGLRLTRNQGLIFGNYLFTLVIRDLSNIAEGESLGTNLPSNLHYTTEEENSISIQHFISIINNEKNLLGRINSYNALDLLDYVEQAKERMFSQQNLN